MRIFLLSALLCISLDVISQNPDLVYLWPGKVPGEPKEKQGWVFEASRGDNVTRIAEVTNPAIELFPASQSNNNNAAVVVCPGGAYNILAYDKEGIEIAKWLNMLGYSAFVLSYRVPGKKEGALQDAIRAIRIVKSNAAKWNIDVSKIGIMGFSAGGSLSARTSTMFDRKTYTPVDKADSLSGRPAFAILIYPAYLDQGPDRTLSPELTITQDTPSMFIFQTADDPYGNSALVMAGALRDSKIPVELHFLQAGGHGYGLRTGNKAAETWPQLAAIWMNNIPELKK